jgi:hypothetical protein
MERRELVSWNQDREGHEVWLNIWDKPLHSLVIQLIFAIHLGNALHILNQMTDTQMISFTLHRLKYSSLLLAAFPSLLRKYIKVHIGHWSSNQCSLQNYFTSSMNISTFKFVALWICLPMLHDYGTLRSCAVIDEST